MICFSFSTAHGVGRRGARKLFFPKKNRFQFSQQVVFFVCGIVGRRQRCGRLHTMWRERLQIIIHSFRPSIGAVRIVDGIKCDTKAEMEKQEMN